MKAAVLKKPENFRVVDLPVPKIIDDQVLVKTKICGICTSELDIWAGKVKGMQYPMSIGHEVAGTIVECGSKVISHKPGDSVAIWTEEKGYAEYIAVKAKNIYKLQDETLVETALGEPISCAVNGVRKLKMDINENVCIVGCGFMGLIMLQVFKVCGAGLLIAVDIRDDVLDFARRLGATHVFNPKEFNVISEVKKLTDDKGVDIGVEAAGNQRTLDLTVDLVRMEGKLEIFGFHQGGSRRVDWGYWNWMAFQVVNGHSRSAHIYLEGMRLGLELLETNKLNLRDLITHRFSIDDINDGFQLATSKPEGFLKGVIYFG